MSGMNVNFQASCGSQMSACSHGGNPTGAQATQFAADGFETFNPTSQTGQNFCCSQGQDATAAGGSEATNPNQNAGGILQALGNFLSQVPGLEGIGKLLSALGNMLSGENAAPGGGAAGQPGNSSILESLASLFEKIPGMEKVAELLRGLANPTGSGTPESAAANSTEGASAPTGSSAAPESQSAAPSSAAAAPNGGIGQILDLLAALFEKIPGMEKVGELLKALGSMLGGGATAPNAAQS